MANAIYRFLCVATFIPVMLVIGHYIGELQAGHHIWWILLIGFSMFPIAYLVDVRRRSREGISRPWWPKGDLWPGQHD